RAIEPSLPMDGLAIDADRSSIPARDPGARVDRQAARASPRAPVGRVDPDLRAHTVVDVLHVEVRADGRAQQRPGPVEPQIGLLKLRLLAGPAQASTRAVAELAFLERD